MATSIDEAKLKQMLKSAVAEVFEERREFVKQIVEEAMEDIALARAIDEGVQSDMTERDAILRILDDTQ
jgi:hypothetical protein